MQARVKALGHAVHPMLIPFPLGLLATAVVFDIIYLITDRAAFATAAAYAIAAGVIGGLVASPFGWVDWSKIPPGTRAKRVGLVHGIGNTVVVLLFAVSWGIRLSSGAWRPTGWALVCSFVAVVLAVATAWLGGELVERLAVGVDDNANLNAPSSLTHREAIV